MAGKSLISRLAGSKDTVKMGEVMDRVVKLFNSKDHSGLRKLREAYIIGISRQNPRWKPTTVVERVDKNLMYGASRYSEPGSNVERFVGDALRYS